VCSSDLIEDECRSLQRRESAMTLASRYGIHPPEVVTMFLHPRLSRLSFHERCRATGILEEDLVTIMTGDGFKMFLKDLKDISKSIIDLQSLIGISEVVGNGRDAEDMRDYSLESRALDVKSVGNAVQVNVSFFDRARERLRNEIEGS